MHRLNAAVSQHQCEIKLKKKKKIVSPGLELSPEITIKMQVYKMKELRQPQVLEDLEEALML